MELLADLVDPAVALLAAALAWRRRAGRVALRGLASIALVYVVTGLDRAFGWWAAAGLDFSTHTAFYVAAAGVPVAIDRRWAVPLLALLAGYGALMARLGYHPWADTLTSAAAAAAWTWACQRAGSRS